MHIDQLVLAKSSIKRKTHFICLRTCHTADFGQMWPENDTHDWPLGEVVTQWTIAKCGKNKKCCPLLEGFVSLRTSTKYGPNCAPHWRTLSCSRLWQNVAQSVPLIGGFCHAADFNQMWPKLCPSSEDFVTQQTLTKCGPNCAPHWRTLSRSGLRPNVAQNVPLVGGLCLTANFDQMWSNHMPLVGGLCHTADFDQMWSKHVPLDRWLCFAMGFDHIWIDNVLVIKHGGYQTNGF
jgi:hypothetical protein